MAPGLEGGLGFGKGMCVLGFLLITVICSDFLPLASLPRPPPLFAVHILPCFHTASLWSFFPSSSFPHTLLP